MTEAECEMTFYDYDIVVPPRGAGRGWIVTYHLRANTRRLPVGFCKVISYSDGSALRVTQGHSKFGRRERYFTSLDEALTSGVVWARRKERENA
jgi:hypothetical protein